MDNRLCAVAFALALPAVLAESRAVAQEARPLAIVNARILTMEGPPIERGTVLIRDGAVAEVGESVEVPPGSKVVDAAGGTLMPGLVHAWSSAGLARDRTPQATPQRGRRGGGGRRRGGAGGGGSANVVDAASTKVADSIYARQDVFGELLESGVTTLAVKPAGTGFPGLAALLDPSARQQADLAVDDDVYVVIEPAADTNAKKLIRENLDKAKAVLEERKKPKEKPAPAEPKPAADAEKPDGAGEAKTTTPPEGGTPPEPPAPKEGEKGAAEPEKPPQQPPKAEEKDPDIELLADLLDGKQRAFLAIDSATDLLHYLDAVGGHRFPAVVVADRPQSDRGRLDEVLVELKKLDATVLLRPDMTTIPFTQTLVNPAAELDAAGIEVGFVLGNSAAEIRGLMFKLMELVRNGLPADKALRGVTLTPAKALKLDDRVGSIKVGKRADLLLWSGDPLDPQTKLVSVFHGGREVKEGLDR